MSNRQQSRSRSRRFGASGLDFQKGKLVDLIGIEPMTSSMPWKSQKHKLLTAKALKTG